MAKKKQNNTPQQTSDDDVQYLENVPAIRTSKDTGVQYLENVPAIRTPGGPKQKLKSQLVSNAAVSPSLQTSAPMPTIAPVQSPSVLPSAQKIAGRNTMNISPASLLYGQNDQQTQQDQPVQNSFFGVKRPEGLYGNNNTEQDFFQGPQPTKLNVAPRIDTSTASGMEAYIWNNYTGKARDDHYAMLDAAYNTYGSPYYSPYRKVTNSAYIDQLKSYGIEVPDTITAGWLESTGAALEQYLNRSTATGTPKSPGTNASPAEQAAYILYQMRTDELSTQKAEQEWAELRDQITYWTKKGLSDREIKAKINMNQFPTLKSMDESLYTGKVNGYNRVIGYSQDAIDGVIWKARNAGYDDTDDFTAAVYSKMHSGVGDHNSWRSVSSRIPGNENYMPYNSGCTNDDARRYFGMDSFDWETIRYLQQKAYLEGDRTAEEFIDALAKAENNTENAKAELDALWTKVMTWDYTSDITLGEDETLEGYFERKLDAWLEKKGQTLKTMDDYRLRGSYLPLNDSVNYRKEDIIDYMTHQYLKTHDMTMSPKEAIAEARAKSVTAEAAAGKTGENSGMDNLNKTVQDILRNVFGVSAPQEENQTEEQTNGQTEAVTSPTQSTIEAMAASSGVTLKNDSKADPRRVDALEARLGDILTQAESQNGKIVITPESGVPKAPEKEEEEEELELGSLENDFPDNFTAEKEESEPSSAAPTTSEEEEEEEFTLSSLENDFSNGLTGEFDPEHNYAHVDYDKAYAALRKGFAGNALTEEEQEQLDLIEELVPGVFGNANRLGISEAGSFVPGIFGGTPAQGQSTTLGGYNDQLAWALEELTSGIASTSEMAQIVMQLVNDAEIASQNGMKLAEYYNGGLSRTDDLVELLHTVDEKQRQQEIANRVSDEAKRQMYIDSVTSIIEKGARGTSLTPEEAKIANNLLVTDNEVDDILGNSANVGYVNEWCHPMAVDMKVSEYVKAARNDTESVNVDGAYYFDEKAWLTYGNGIADQMRKDLAQVAKIANEVGLSLGEFYEKYPEYNMSFDDRWKVAKAEYAEKVSLENMTTEDLEYANKGLGWLIAAASVSGASNDVLEGTVGFVSDVLDYTLGNTMTLRRQYMTRNNGNQVKAAQNYKSDLLNYAYALAANGDQEKAGKITAAITQATISGDSIFSVGISVDQQLVEDFNNRTFKQWETNIDNAVYSQGTEDEIFWYDAIKSGLSSAIKMGFAAGLKGAGVPLPLASPIAFFGGTYHATYESERANGVDKKNAALNSALVAATDSITEMPSVALGYNFLAEGAHGFGTLMGKIGEDILRRVGPGVTLSNLAKRTASAIAFWAETGLVEGSQEVGQDIIGGTLLKTLHKAQAGKWVNPKAPETSSQEPVDILRFGAKATNTRPYFRNLTFTETMDELVGSAIEAVGETFKPDNLAQVWLSTVIATTVTGLGGAAISTKQGNPTPIAKGQTIQNYYAQQEKIENLRKASEQLDSRLAEQTSNAANVDESALTEEQRAAAASLKADIDGMISGENAPAWNADNTQIFEDSQDGQTQLWQNVMQRAEALFSENNNQRERMRRRSFSTLMSDMYEAGADLSEDVVGLLWEDLQNGDYGSALRTIGELVPQSETVPSAQIQAWNADNTQGFEEEEEELGLDSLASQFPNNFASQPEQQQAQQPQAQPSEQTQEEEEELELGSLENSFPGNFTSQQQEQTQPEQQPEQTPQDNPLEIEDSAGNRWVIAGFKGGRVLFDRADGTGGRLSYNLNNLNSLMSDEQAKKVKAVQNAFLQTGSLPQTQPQQAPVPANPQAAVQPVQSPTGAQQTVSQARAILDNAMKNLAPLTSTVDAGMIRLQMVSNLMDEIGDVVALADTSTLTKDQLTDFVKRVLAAEAIHEGLTSIDESVASRWASDIEGVFQGEAADPVRLSDILSEIAFDLNGMYNQVSTEVNETASSAQNYAMMQVLKACLVHAYENPAAFETMRRQLIDKLNGTSEAAGGLVTTPEAQKALGAATDAQEKADEEQEKVDKATAAENAAKRNFRSRHRQAGTNPKAATDAANAAVDATKARQDAEEKRDKAQAEADKAKEEANSVVAQNRAQLNSENEATADEQLQNEAAGVAEATAEEDEAPQPVKGEQYHPLGLQNKEEQANSKAEAESVADMDDDAAEQQTAFVEDNQESLTPSQTDQATLDKISENLKGVKERKEGAKRDTQVLTKGQINKVTSAVKADPELGAALASANTETLAAVANAVQPEVAKKGKADTFNIRQILRKAVGLNEITVESQEEQKPKRKRKNSKALGRTLDEAADPESAQKQEGVFDVLESSAPQPENAQTGESSETDQDNEESDEDEEEQDFGPFTREEAEELSIAVQSKARFAAWFNNLNDQLEADNFKEIQTKINYGREVWNRLHPEDPVPSIWDVLNKARQDAAEEASAPQPTQEEQGVKTRAEERLKRMEEILADLQNYPSNFDYSEVGQEAFRSKRWIELLTRKYDFGEEYSRRANELWEQIKAYEPHEDTSTAPAEEQSAPAAPATEQTSEAQQTSSEETTDEDETPRMTIENRDDVYSLAENTVRQYNTTGDYTGVRELFRAIFEWNDQHPDDTIEGHEDDDGILIDDEYYTLISGDNRVIKDFLDSLTRGNYYGSYRSFLNSYYMTTAANRKSLIAELNKRLGFDSKNSITWARVEETANLLDETGLPVDNYTREQYEADIRREMEESKVRDTEQQTEEAPQVTITGDDAIIKEVFDGWANNNFYASYDQLLKSRIDRRAAINELNKKLGLGSENKDTWDRAKKTAELLDNAHLPVNGYTQEQYEADTRREIEESIARDEEQRKAKEAEQAEAEKAKAEEAAAKERARTSRPDITHGQNTRPVNSVDMSDNRDALKELSKGTTALKSSGKLDLAWAKRIIQSLHTFIETSQRGSSGPVWNYGQDKNGQGNIDRQGRWVKESTAYLTAAEAIAKNLGLDLKAMGIDLKALKTNLKNAANAWNSWDGNISHRNAETSIHPIRNEEIEPELRQAFTDAFRTYGENLKALESALTDAIWGKAEEEPAAELPKPEVKPQETTEQRKANAEPSRLDRNQRIQELNQKYQGGKLGDQVQALMSLYGKFRNTGVVLDQQYTRDLIADTKEALGLIYDVLLNKDSSGNQKSGYDELSDAITLAAKLLDATANLQKAFVFSAAGNINYTDQYNKLGTQFNRALSDFLANRNALRELDKTSPEYRAMVNQNRQLLASMNAISNQFKGAVNHNEALNNLERELADWQYYKDQKAKPKTEPVKHFARGQLPNYKQSENRKGPFRSPVQVFNTLTKDLGIGNYNEHKPTPMTRSVSEGEKGYYRSVGDYIVMGNRRSGEQSAGLHEISHAVMDRTGFAETDQDVEYLKNSLTAVYPEFNDFLDQYDTAEQPGEIRAEFMRMWLQNPEQAEYVFGTDYVNEFEKDLQKQKDIWKSLKKVLGDIRSYAAASAGEQVDSRIVRSRHDDRLSVYEQGILKWGWMAAKGLLTGKYSFGDITRSFSTGVIADDDAARAFDRASVGEDGERSKVQEWIRMLKFFDRTGNINLTERMTDGSGVTVNDVGLSQAMNRDLDTNEVLINNEDDYALFERYSLAEIAVERYREGLRLAEKEIDKLGLDEFNPADAEEIARIRHEATQAKTVFGDDISIEQLQDIIDDVEANHPNIVKSHQQTMDWWHQFMDVWFPLMGISEETIQKLQQKYPSYIPTKRDILDANIDFDLWHVKGSTLDIVTPFVTMQENVMGVIYKAYRNRIAKEVYDALMRQEGDNSIDLGEYAVLLPDDVAPGATAVNEGKVINYKDGDGFSHYIEIRDDLLGEVLAESQGDAGEILNTIGKLTRTMAMATTGMNARFSVKNFVRDFQKSVNYGSWASWYGSGIVKWAIAAAEVLRDTDTHKLYMNLGGGGFNMFGNASTEHAANQLIRNVLPNYGNDTKIGRAAERAAKLTKGIFTMNKLNEVIEQTSRYAEFRFGKHDLSTPEGRMEAFLAAQDATVDFARRGNSAFAAAMRKIIPFWNASIQGQFQNLEMFTQEERDRLAPRLTKHIVNNMLTGALAWALLNMFGDDEDKKWYETLSDEIKWDNIILPFMDNKEHRRRYLRMPLAQDFYAKTFYQVGRLLMDYQIGGEVSLDLAGFIQHVIGDSFKSDPVWQPYLDVLMNKNYYGGQQIPDYLLDKNIDEQFVDTTPEIFIQMSRALNAIGIQVAPIHLQYLTEQYSGFVGQNLMPLISPDKLNPDEEGLHWDQLVKSLENSFTIDPAYTNDVNNAYYAGKKMLEQIKGANGVYSSHLSTDLSDAELQLAVDEATQLLGTSGAIAHIDAQIKSLRDQMAKIAEDQNFNTTQKEIMRRNIMQQIVELEGDGLKYLSEYQDRYCGNKNVIQTVLGYHRVQPSASALTKYPIQLIQAAYDGDRGMELMNELYTDSDYTSPTMTSTYYDEDGTKYTLKGMVDDDGNSVMSMYGDEWMKGYQEAWKDWGPDIETAMRRNDTESKEEADDLFRQIFRDANEYAKEWLEDYLGKDLTTSKPKN